MLIRGAICMQLGSEKTLYYYEFLVFNSFHKFLGFNHLNHGEFLLYCSSSFWISFCFLNVYRFKDNHIASLIYFKARSRASHCEIINQFIFFQLEHCTLIWNEYCCASFKFHCSSSIKFTSLHIMIFFVWSWKTL